MSKKNIAVLVSGGGTNLQALIDAQNRREINGGEIGMVVSSSPEAYALERAKQANIPGYILPRKNWPSNQAYTRALVSLLQEMGADMVVLAGFMTILTEEIVQAYPNKILNVHPALIPSFCGKGAYGLHVHEQALDYGVKVTGATVHLVTAEPDGGPIVLQKAIDILPWDTPESLQRRVMEECEWKLLPKAVDLLCRDNLKVEGRTVRIIGGRVIV
jgi:phosphoribosylglycinamide formyltransferase-1